MLDQKYHWNTTLNIVDFCVCLFLWEEDATHPYEEIKTFRDA